MTTTPKRDEPVAILQHSNAAAEWAASEPRVPVFTVIKPSDREWQEGDPEHVRDEMIVYTMPAKPNPGIALDYLKRARRTDPDQAASWLIEKAIGEDGYDALVEELAGLEGDEALKTLQAVVGKIQAVAMGGLEPPKAQR